MIELVHGLLPMLHGVVPALREAATYYSSNSDSNSGGEFALLAAGPVGAVALYWTIFRYYRNTDKTNQFERETRVEAKPVQGYDKKVDEVHGTRDPRIDGNNASNFRLRVERVPSDPQPSGPTTELQPKQPQAAPAADQPPAAPPAPAVPLPAQTSSPEVSPDPRTPAPTAPTDPPPPAD